MKNDLDLTQGPLAKKIYRFALPLALTSVLQQLFNVADLAVVGRFAGTEAMAAVGTNAILVNLVLNLFFGLSLGCTVVIAQSLGAKDLDKVRKAVHSSVIVAIAGGILVMIIGELLTEFLIDLLQVPVEVHDMAVLYFRIFLLGLPVIVLYNFIAATFRADGDSKTPLIVLVSSGILNVVLNLIFVVGFHRSVDGVATATVISNTVSATLLVIALVRSKRPIKLSLRYLKIDKEAVVEIFKVGLPSGLQNAVFTIANMVIQVAVNSLGTVVIAASSASLNVEALTCFVMNSFGQTATTFVGQNYGAGNMERCRKVLGQVFLHGYICNLTLEAILVIFSSQIMGLFSTDPEVIAYGSQRLCILCIGYLFSMWQEVGSGYLRGFGISAQPAIISLVGACALRIIWVLTVFQMSPTFLTLIVIYPITLFIVGSGILLYIWIVKPSRKFAQTEHKD